MIIENSVLYSVWDTSDWTITDWNSLPPNAISLSGNNMIARNNYIKNINFGISVTGAYCLVENNTVENFAGDGMRGLGDYGTFQYNTIKNSYDVNENHDDGFQSWSWGDDGRVGTGVVKGIVLRGNTFINWEDKDQPFRGSFQGIGCFDGMFEDWLIIDNVVMVDHWHGISLYGAINCLIENNTVIDILEGSPGPTRIWMNNHKNGTPPSGTIVRNNLVTDLFLQGDTQSIDNQEIDFTNYEDTFVDWENYNFELKDCECCVGSHLPCEGPLNDPIDIGCESSGNFCCEKCVDEKSYTCDSGTCCSECFTTETLHEIISGFFAGTNSILDVIENINIWKS
jgi:parallel beta-helix repeat protein